MDLFMLMMYKTETHMKMFLYVLKLNVYVKILSF